MHLLNTITDFGYTLPHMSHSNEKTDFVIEQNEAYGMPLYGRLMLFKVLTACRVNAKTHKMKWLILFIHQFEFYWLTDYYHFRSLSNYYDNGFFLYSPSMLPKNHNVDGTQNHLKLITMISIERGNLFGLGNTFVIPMDWNVLPHFCVQLSIIFNDFKMKCGSILWKVIVINRLPVWAWQTI